MLLRGRLNVVVAVAAVGGGGGGDDVDDRDIFDEVSG